MSGAALHAHSLSRAPGVQYNDRSIHLIFWWLCVRDALAQRRSRVAAWVARERHPAGMRSWVLSSARGPRVLGC
jgi:hypothetical protein